MSNAIVTENANTGTTQWQVTNGATTEIQAYCDATSYNPGDTVTFYASTQVAATAWTLRIYRMGWYDSRGGCLKHTSAAQTGVAQGYYDQSDTSLHNCPTAILNTTTHLQEAGWASSYTWSIPNPSTTGLYLCQFTDANGKQTYCHFVVKTAAAADYVHSYPYTTDAAYNQWGGWSLYAGTPSRAYAVSLNRPEENGRGSGAGNLFVYNGLSLIKWIERQGYNVAYVSDLDIHVTGASLFDKYSAALFGSHDEYWSYEMRSAIETALGRGVGLAFLGANAVYWQVRMGTDSGGHANRTITCYKVQTGGGGDTALASDPQYGIDNTRVTARWRDAVLNRPEAALIGVMFSSVIFNSANVAWRVDSAAGSDPYLVGTGLVAGTSYGADLVGVEYDNQQASSPAGLRLLGTTSVQDSGGGADTAHTAYYVAPSGALVFAAGSIGWTYALDTLRHSNAGTPQVIAGMQTLMANVMAALVLVKAGNGHPVGGARFHI